MISDLNSAWAQVLAPHLAASSSLWSAQSVSPSHNHLQQGHHYHHTYLISLLSPSGNTLAAVLAQELVMSTLVTCTPLLSSYIMDTNGHKAWTSHSVVVCSLTSPACVLLSCCWWVEVRGRKERAGGGARASTANTPPSQTMSGILSRAPEPLFRLSSSYLLRPLLRQSSGCLQLVFRLSSGKDSLQQAVFRLSSGCQ